MTTSPFTALNLLDTATPAEVDARYREMAKVAHPDAGGDAAAFATLNAAYHAARARAVVCPRCEGVGAIWRNRGWERMRLPCPACKGLGTRR